MSNSKILTSEEVAEIEARANAATEGPWHTAKRRAALIIAEDKARVADCHVGIGMAVDEAQINAEFMAHALTSASSRCLLASATWATERLKA